MRYSAVLFLASIAAGAQSSTPPQAIRPQKKIVIFDGKSLEGLSVWTRETKREDPKHVFSVQNGMLRISGEDWGGIATVNSYRDYHLIVEWRWGGPTHGNRVKSARDSGILIHAHGEDGAAGGVWMESIESQIIEGGTGDIILVAGKGKPALTVDTRTGPDKQLYWTPGGTPVTRDSGRFNWQWRDVNWKDTIGYRGPKDVEKATGKWNRQEVICDGAAVKMILNGVLVNEGRGAVPDEGRIQLQSEGAEIWVRRFELRPVKR